MAGSVSGSVEAAKGLSRRRLIAASAAAGALAMPARGQAKPLRIGVLGDQSGPYADFSGPGSVIAAQLAAEEFKDGVLGRPVEILSGDHGNKPDLASAMARSWIDTKDVEAVVECSTSGCALAVQQVMRERARIFLITVAGSSDLTGKNCSPFGFHFNCDTYELARSTGLALTRLGGDSWFFITVDYAFGHALQRDAARFVQEAGGKVLGSVLHPLGASDFASYLTEAQASGAKVVAFANAGADTQNAIKQAREFGLGRGNQRLAALLTFITDIRSVGLQTAQGLVLSNTFYWDLDDNTRAWTKRFRAHKNAPPTMDQAAAYCSVRHFLRATQAAGTSDSPKVAATMRDLPVSDMYNDNVRIRPDGRVLSKVYLMTVKSPAESAYADDAYRVLASTEGAEAARPLSESECPLVHR